MRTKKEMRDLVADGHLAEATAAALGYAEACGDTDTLNGLSILHSDLHRNREAWLSNLLSYEESSREQSRIAKHLLGRIDELPDEPSTRAAQKRIRESTFKWLVFYLFLASKIIVFLFTLWVWQVHGFLTEEAVTAFNALLPGLVVYASIMFRSLLRSSLGDEVRRFVPARFRTLIWMVFPTYIVIQIALIVLKAEGMITFTTMNFAILGVEAGFGRFVGEVTEELFKK